MKRPIKAGELRSDAKQLAPTEPLDADQRIIRGTVVASSGIGGLYPNTQTMLRFGSKFVCIWLRTSENKLREFGMPYSEVDFVQIGGRGTVSRTTDAGMIGGGFGIQGALEGMAIAAVVNAATRQTITTTNTIVHFKAGVREVVLRNETFDPTALRVMLSPSLDRIERSRPKLERSSQPGSVADKLKDLTRMQDEGLISEDEFAAIRARLLKEF